jgi:RNA polymerase sigma factor (sigma-70 family)
MLLSKKEREFRRSYSDHYAAVLGALYRRVGNMEDAEDICHEIFVSYYNKFDEVRDPRSWLFGAMKFCISNYYRKKTGADRSCVDIDDIEDDITLAFENGARDMRIIISEAIEHGDNYKDEKDRLLFDLVAVNGYTYEEAARHLGLTRRQAFYRYRLVTRRIVDYLNSRGISHIEDLL